MRAPQIILLAAMVSTGCASVGINAAFVGTPTPVLLGPRDRVGVAAPAAITKLAEFEGEAFWRFSQGSTTNYATGIRTDWSRQEQTGQYALSAACYKATNGFDPALDVRLTKVKTSAYGNLFTMRNYVTIEGDVVRPGGGR